MDTADRPAHPPKRPNTSSREGWSRVTLGEVVTLRRGFDLPAAARRPGTVPVISSSGITGYHNVARIDPPSVVTGRYGTLGEVFFIDQPSWPLNTTLYVQDFKGNDPRYISYLLKTMGFHGRSVAAAVPGVNRNDLHRLTLLRPPLPEQRRIASVLSAYDDLVENNARRIQILEEMAQAIYREWFVEFRFPGHEGVPMVDSQLGPIPEGWRVAPLQTEAILEYGRALKENDRVDGAVPVVGSSGVVGYHSDALVPGPGIVVGRKGNAGSIIWIDSDFFPIDTTFYVQTKHELLFVYYQLRQVAWVTSDTAVPGLSRRQAYAELFLCPPASVERAFTDVAEPMRYLIHSLQRSNTVLRESRDLLLPRLISGEIDVSNLDTGNAEPAA